MPLRTRNGGNDTVIREEYVGSATRRICYPGISSCIAVTAVTEGGLAGTHITIGTPAQLVDELFQTMKTGGAGGAPNVYVVGRLGHFKPSADASINTRKKIRDRILDRINSSATVRFYDTTAHGAAHVFAAKNGLEADFSWITEPGNTVAGFTYPDFAGTTAILPGQFMIR